MNKIGYVVASAPAKIIIEIDGLEILEKNKNELQIGKFLKIADGNHNYAVATINNINSAQVSDKDEKLHWRFTLEATPLGALLYNGANTSFTRGTPVLPVPTEPVFIFNKEDIKAVFSKTSSLDFKIGHLAGNSLVPIFIDGNKFFGKHVGVVGSTGAGKSCTVASLLQNAMGISNAKNSHANAQKNSHVIIFDIHAEYAAAFKIADEEKFNLNLLDVDKLKIPYWLMNAEELETIFIETGEQNSHNQISQFKKAVIANKEKYNPKLQKINYDTPAYFSIKEVYNYIKNKNNFTSYEKNSKTYFASIDLKDIEISEENLWHPIAFEASSGNGSNKSLNAKVSKEGGFNGEFDRFVSRLETRLADKRLNFLLDPKKDNDLSFKTDDFEKILQQFIGYIDKSNVTVIDLSGVPFEVLSITISLISRLIFDFAFHYSKICHAQNRTNDIPLMLVCEEAHNYIPQNSSADYNSSKKSIERIAKEGRKYGLSLMVVSQRPSEVSDTIFSQCSNFVTLRLTNKFDQSYIRGLLPDSSSQILELLPVLGQGEAYVVGDATLMPSLVQLPPPNPEPKSATIKTFAEWSKDWKNINFNDVIQRWHKEPESLNDDEL
ncbi:ATP-binding protein [Massilia forsythiae]|nr:ATP-binding protein [Massilia forsythiae]